MNNQNIIKGDLSIILNIVRITAAEMVLLGHIIAWNGINTRFNPKIGNSIIELSLMADFGVVLFFIISGLLISNSVFSKLINKKYSFGMYFIARFARIYSGLIPCLMVIFILDSIHVSQFYKHFLSYAVIAGDKFTFFHDYSITNFIGCIFMLQRLPVPAIDIGFGFGSARPLWTLSIEWWLYLLFGWAFINYKLFTSKKNKYLVLLLIFSIIPLSNFLIKSYGSLIVVWYLGVLITVILSDDYLCALINKVKLKYFISILLFIFAVLRSLKMQTAHDLSSNILVISAFILVLPGFRTSNIFTNDKMRLSIKFISDYSFTLYLIHMPIITLIAAFNISNLFGLMVVSFLASNVLAALVAYPTEMKHKQLGRWMENKIYSKTEASEIS